MYQARHKLRSDGRGRIKLCSGKGNTCEKEAKKEGTCAGCKSGRDRTVFENRAEGEIFIDARGTRYRIIGGQARQLCTYIESGDIKCDSAREDAKGLCRGHMNGTKRHKIPKDTPVGQEIEFNGEIRIWNGIQLCKPCNELGCKQYSVIGGKCKTHSPEWKCRFAETTCTNIRMYGNFCTIHKDGILNPRKKSEGEARIGAYLDELGMLHEDNKYIKHNDQVLYPDVDIIGLNTIIEFDGQQHFKAIDYWGGEEFLIRQQACDIKKDAWVRETGRRMLRISHKDIDSIEEIIRLYLDTQENYPPGSIIATRFYDCTDRDYTII